MSIRKLNTVTLVFVYYSKYKIIIFVHLQYRSQKVQVVFIGKHFQCNNQSSNKIGRTKQMQHSQDSCKHQSVNHQRAE